jgi:hypothetical protein
LTFDGDVDVDSIVDLARGPSGTTLVIENPAWVEVDVNDRVNVNVAVKGNVPRRRRRSRRGDHSIATGDALFDSC